MQGENDGKEGGKGGGGSKSLGQDKGSLTYGGERGAESDGDRTRANVRKI